MLLGGCCPKNMKVNWDHYSQLEQKKVPNHQPVWVFDGLYLGC
jgi:hypothetical protein